MEVGSFSVAVGVAYDTAASRDKGYDVWETVDVFTYYIGDVSNNVFITVPKGFVTDGASVPRIFWDIFPPWGIYGQAAVLHDWMCTYLKYTKNGENEDLSMTVAQADQLLYQAMGVLGTPQYKRVVIYAAVRAYHVLWKPFKTWFMKWYKKLV